MISWLRNKLAKRSIKSRFNSYVDPDLVKYIAAHPDENLFAATEKNVTVGFSKLRGFASLAGNLKDELIPLLTETIEARVRVLRKHGCFIYQQVADTIFFGANTISSQPDHALRYARAADEMGAEWLARDRKLEMVISLASGLASVGDVGGKSFSAFTAIGPPVNDATKLSKYPANGRVRILMNENTALAIRDEFEVVFLEEVEMEGRDTRLKVFELGHRKKL